MGNLGGQKITSRQIANIGQRKSIFQESKFPPVVQNVKATSATTDLSEYRQPKTGEMIANVMKNFSESNYSPPPNYIKGKPLQAPRPQPREPHIAPVHQLKAPPRSGFATAQVPTPNKTGLPDRLKAGVENLSGYSLDNVRVHYNSSKPAQLQALAYTQGTDIHVAPGQEKHLPHEAWHVVQQMQGKVKPTMEAQGVAINDDRSLEREADLMGVKATSAKRPDTFSYVEKTKENKSSSVANSVSQKKSNVKEKFLFEDKRTENVKQLKMLSNFHNRNVLEQTNPPVQRQSILGRGRITGTVNYQAKNNNGIQSAYRMKAQNIRLTNPTKTALPKGNEPEVDPPGWDKLKGGNLTRKPPHYKRMHLLNAELGGHGNKIENLAPGSSKLNSRHSNEIECKLRDKVKKGRTIQSYEVVANYRGSGLKRFKPDTINIYKHTLESIHCKYQTSDGTKGSQKIAEPPRTAGAWPNKLDSRSS